MPPFDKAFYETYGLPPKAWKPRLWRIDLPENARGREAILFLDARNIAGPPGFLRVKVERKGGLQAHCWQLVAIESPKQEPGQEIGRTDADVAS